MENEVDGRKKNKKIVEGVSQAVRGVENGSVTIRIRKGEIQTIEINNHEAFEDLVDLQHGWGI